MSEPSKFWFFFKILWDTSDSVEINQLTLSNIPVTNGHGITLFLRLYFVYSVKGALLIG